MAKPKAIPITINIPVHLLKDIAAASAESAFDEWDEDIVIRALKNLKTTSTQLQNEVLADPKLMKVITKYVQDFVDNGELYDYMANNCEFHNFADAKKLWKACEKACIEIEKETEAELAKIREQEAAVILNLAIDGDILKELASALKKKGLKIVKA